jgi:ribonuclease R
MFILKMLRVTDVGDDGQAWAVPESWHADTPAPRLRVREKGRRGALGIGDRILARTEEAGNGWIAHPLKSLAKGEELMLGVLREEGGKLWLIGVDKRERREHQVSDAGGANPGDLVLAEKTGRPPRITARVTQVLGDPFAPRSFSMIAIHKLGIPVEFAPEAIEEAGEVARQPLGEDREDLRHLPIVAIDPEDARDHDDAVWAAPDDDPDVSGARRDRVAGDARRFWPHRRGQRLCRVRVRPRGDQRPRRLVSRGRGRDGGARDLRRWPRLRARAARE